MLGISHPKDSLFRSFPCHSFMFVDLTKFNGNINDDDLTYQLIR